MYSWDVLPSAEALSDLCVSVRPRGQAGMSYCAEKCFFRDSDRGSGRSGLLCHSRHRMMRFLRAIQFSLGGSCSIWAELEGLLAKEIVFIQCIHNQAPYLSVHLSLSRTHTLPTSSSAPRPTHIIHSLTRTQYTAGNTHTQSFTFCSLSVCTPAAWSHTFGEPHISCVPTQTHRHM